MQLDLNPKNKENSIMIKIKTTSGDIEIKLYEEEAPISSENFKSYVKDGFFEGTIFHRVIPNFMVQGGGMTENMENKSTNAPIKNEANNGKRIFVEHLQWQELWKLTVQHRNFLLI